MANTNTPYIGKNAAPLVNPTTATVFSERLQPIATVAATQGLRPVFVKYNGWASAGAGTSDNRNLIAIAVRIGLRVTGGATTNFSLALQVSNSQPLPGAIGSTANPATPGATLVTLTPTAFNSTSGHLYFSATLMWDPNSGTIDGTYSGFGGGTIIAPTAITPVGGFTATAPAATQIAANANPTATGEMVLFFTPTALFSASNAGNVANLDIFDVEEL